MTTGLLTVPYLYQQKGVAKLLRMLRHGGAILADEMGLGKAQPNDTKVMTPHGYRLLKNLRVGDLVTGSDGQPTTVTGVFPQGKKVVYQITFRDGSSTRCCDDHLWAVQTPARRFLGQPCRVLPLKEIKNDLFDAAGNAKHFVPMVSPVAFIDQGMGDLPLDPYLLGYLLANGCLRGSAKVTIPDQETVERLTPLLPRGYVLKRDSEYDYRITRKVRKGRPNKVITALRELGAFGKMSYQKRIPKRYLFSSTEVRLRVLQGLMDGDGTAGAKDGRIEFDSSSRGLVKDVRFIVQSLGGTGIVSLRQSPTYTYKGEKRTGLPSWRLGIRMPAGTPAFLLSRKADRRGTAKYHPSRPIVAVEEVGVEPCRCISVAAADNLYVTEDFIVTHNTLSAIAVYAELRKLHPGRPLLVVCPAGLRLNWQNEFRIHLGIHATVLEGRKCDVDLLSGEAFILGYDTVGSPDGKHSWARAIRRVRPCLVVLDECHLLKSRAAKRTKFVVNLARRIPHTLAMSGTPLVNRPVELWPVINLCRPDLYPNFMEFAHRHCRPERKPWGWEFKGADHIDELHHDLTMNMMVRRLKADVLKDLPGKRRHVVPVEIVDRPQYEEAHHSFIQWMKKNYRHKLRGAKKAEILVQMGYMIRLVGRLKLPAVVEWADDWLTRTKKKLLLFGRHTKPLEFIRDEFRRHGAVLITGSVLPRKRKAIQATFQTNPRCRLFVGNMDAAGAGWNATAGKATAFAEYDWRPGIHMQCEDRIHRIGQTEGTDHYYLTAIDTIEDKLVAVLREKQLVLDATLDGGDVPDALSVFDDFLARIL